MGCELTTRQPPPTILKVGVVQPPSNNHSPVSSTLLTRRCLQKPNILPYRILLERDGLQPSNPARASSQPTNRLPHPEQTPPKTQRSMATPTQPQDITAPITPARFAAALKDLSPASLHLKVLEIRNSLAHLAHSNAQLRPFAEGAAAAPGATPGEPDADCADAIRENEAVIERMRGRVELVRAEVEARGLSWGEFEAKDELEDDEPGVPAAPAPAATPASGVPAAAPVANGVNGHAGDGAGPGVGGAAPSRGNPWEDGTFQTGVIRNGEIHMDAVPNRQGSSAAPGQTNGGGGGGRLTDEELRRRLEERLAEDNDDEDAGLHL